MFWVLVFGGLALAGLAVLAGYAVWLAHKAGDVLGELKVLADRGAQLADLVAQVRLPETGGAAAGTVVGPVGHSPRTGSAQLGPGGSDIG